MLQIQYNPLAWRPRDLYQSWAEWKQSLKCPAASQCGIWIHHSSVTFLTHDSDVFAGGSSTTPDPFLYNSFPASCSSYFIYAVDSACLREGSCTSPSSISAHIPHVAKIILNSALAAQCVQHPPSQPAHTLRVGIINEQPGAQGSSSATLLIGKLIVAFCVEVSNNFTHTDMLSQISADSAFFTFERQGQKTSQSQDTRDSVLLPWHVVGTKYIGWNYCFPQKCHSLNVILV